MQRLRQAALSIQGIADVVEGNRQLCLIVGALGLFREQRLEDVPRFRGRFDSALAVSERLQGGGRLYQSCGLTAAQILAGLARSEELVLQLQRPVEHVLDRRCGHADDLPEFLSEIEDETVSGLSRQCECVLGAIALGLRLPPIDLGEDR